MLHTACSSSAKSPSESGRWQGKWGEAVVCLSFLGLPLLDPVTTPAPGLPSSLSITVNVDKYVRHCGSWARVTDIPNSNCMLCLHVKHWCLDWLPWIYARSPPSWSLLWLHLSRTGDYFLWIPMGLDGLIKVLARLGQLYHTCARELILIGTRVGRDRRQWGKHTER